MPEEKAKKNTGLIIGIACGAVAVVAAIIVVLVIILGGGGPNGKYTLTGMIDSDGKDMSSLISLMSLGGATPYIEFKDGGKCDVSNMSSGFSADEDGVTQKEAKVECSFTKDTITSTDGSEKEEMKYTVDGDKVTLSMKDGSKMIFTKQ